MSEKTEAWWEGLGLWCCHRIGWHQCPKSLVRAGINLKGTCPRCGKAVMRDSQGNWF